MGDYQRVTGLWTGTSWTCPNCIEDTNGCSTNMVYYLNPELNKSWAVFYCKKCKTPLYYSSGIPEILDRLPTAVAIPAMILAGEILAVSPYLISDWWFLLVPLIITLPISYWFWRCPTRKVSWQAFNLEEAGWPRERKQANV